MPRPSNCPLRRNRLARAGKPSIRQALVLLLALSTLGAGCATKGPTPEEIRAHAAFPLQATSLQPAPYVPALAPVPSADGSVVTKPWMEEQLRTFDDRYAQAAADIKVVFEQSVATMKAAVTPADLKPLTVGVGKVGADLTALSGRFESMVSSLQTRMKELERTLSETKTSAGPAVLAGQTTSVPGPDAESREFTEALKALQATPRQTLPLRAWYEAHAKDPKAPEALFQLGLVFLDSGYPTAGKLYLTRLLDEYGASVQAGEAKALLAPKPAPKPKRPAAPKPDASASSAARKAENPDCDPKVLCAHGQAVPTPATAPPAKDAKEKAEPAGPAPKAAQPEKGAVGRVLPPDTAHAATAVPSGLVPRPAAPPEPAETAPPVMPAAKRLK
jgi:hypothetical protein